MCCELLLPPLGDLCLDGELALWVDGTLADFLQRLAVGIARRQGLANGTGLLLAQIQRLVLLVLEHLAQILLLLLVHHNVDASDGLAYNAAAMAKTNMISPIGTSHTHAQQTVDVVVVFDLHLGELGWCSAGDLSHTQIEQLILELIQLLGELLLVLSSQLGALNLHLGKTKKKGKQELLYLQTLIHYLITSDEFT